MRDLFRFSPLPTIKELLNLYNIKALRNLSQNFLLERTLTDKIVRAAGNLEKCEVCEIGPGPGSITRSILLQNPKKVLAIEKDTRFIPILQALEKTSAEKLKLVYADILQYDLGNSFDEDLKKDWEDSPPDIHIIGNLPFGISNLLIIQYLKDMSLRRNAWKYGRVCLTLTFQKEVAERITATIIAKNRCRLSVMCQNYCQVTYKFTIPGRAFLPKPDVDVGVVHFEPLIQPVINLDFGLIEKVVRTIFNSRQKWSINPAMKLFPESLRKTLGEKLFRLADLDKRVRPYQMCLEEWERLCSAYKSICDKDPLLYTYDFRKPKAEREKNWEECRV